MKYTINDLKEGKVCVLNDGTIDELRDVFSFLDTDILISMPTTYTYYRVIINNKRSIMMSNNPIPLPIQSVKDFLVKELTFPRLMLVSGNNNIKSAVKRVVFIKKNNKYISWTLAETFDEAETETSTTDWDYAWELEDGNKITFPFLLRPEDAQRIINKLPNGQKLKLVNTWANNIVLGNHIIIDENTYKKLYTNPILKELLNEIFK
jgi:hypothetical protein